MGGARWRLPGWGWLIPLFARDVIRERGVPPRASARPRARAGARRQRGPVRAGGGDSLLYVSHTSRHSQPAAAAPAASNPANRCTCRRPAYPRRTLRPACRCCISYCCPVCCRCSVLPCRRAACRRRICRRLAAPPTACRRRRAPYLPPPQTRRHHFTCRRPACCRRTYRRPACRRHFCRRPTLCRQNLPPPSPPPSRRTHCRPAVFAEPAVAVPTAAKPAVTVYT